MILVEYLNSQFSLAQNLDFFIRILTASLCGACIGFERSKRYKEAGIRTHIIVCCAASLMVIVSKYGFADLTDAAGAAYNGTRGADAARIAAQVVSGISFLGAGVIFKHGSSVRGLTTAAGLWATAGIGLAIGAGMYTVGIFTTIAIALFQIMMHKIVVGADSMATTHLRFTVKNSEALQRAMGRYAAEHRQQILECSVRHYDDGFVSYDAIIRSAREVTVRELELFLCEYGDIRDVSLNIL
ncbi:MAG: MgtC/SapB family protein [Oscillospiraceae bacterium]|nr:MgtC/SapB family protein [Oscillospiraceae bacterium]